MKRKNILLLATLLFYFQVNAQVKTTLTRQEAYSYSNLVGNYLDAHDTNIIEKTELVMMFLECDTIGRVTKVHLMAENQEEKSLYGVLKGIMPEYFNNKLVLLNAKEKTIIFPIYSMKYWEDKDNYLDQMRTPWCPFQTEDMSATVQEGLNFIQVNGTYHIVQRPKLEKPPVCDEPEIIVGKKITDKEAIYATVINHLYGNSPASIVITDSTANSHIKEEDFREMAEDYSKKPRYRQFEIFGLDSTWAPTFMEADKKRTVYQKPNCHTLKPDVYT